MDREFIFQTDAVEDFVLPQLTAALESITQHRSRSACPRLWGLTDRLNSSGSAQKPSSLRIGLTCCNFVLGLFLLVTGILGGLIPALFLGLAAWLWSILRLRRHSPKLLTLLSLIAGGLLTLAGTLAPEQLGRILIPGLVTMAIGFLALFSHVREKPDSFQRAAARLLEQRSAMPKGAIRFDASGMSTRSGDLIPYAQWEGCWETDDLLLPLCHDSILILRKGELAGGDFDALRSLLSEHIAITRL